MKNAKINQSLQHDGAKTEDSVKDILYRIKMHIVSRLNFLTKTIHDYLRFEPPMAAW